MLVALSPQKEVATGSGTRWDDVEGWVALNEDPEFTGTYCINYIALRNMKHYYRNNWRQLLYLGG